VYSSNRKRSRGHLSRQGSPELRWATFEAAKCAARRGSPDYAYYRRLATRPDCGKIPTLAVCRTEDPAPQLSHATGARRCRPGHAGPRSEGGGRLNAFCARPVSPAEAAYRWRRTHRPSACSLTPISAAMLATGRPVSITRRAACSRNSGVYFLRSPDTRTSFPRDEQPHESGVHHQGSRPRPLIR
jgi:hypothetical protein